MPTGRQVPRASARRRGVIAVALVLLASVVAIGGPASAGPSGDPTCRSLFPGAEEDTPAGRCRLVDETVIDASTVHVYIHADVPRSRAPDAQVLEHTTEAVQRSYLEYTIVGIMPGQVDIVLVPTLGDEAAANAGPDDRGTCVVFIEASTLRPPSYYKQVLAHELFHCFQFKQIGEAVWNAEHSTGNWWFEGTAEFFSNVVYPRANHEYQFLDTLRELEPGQALVDLSYEAWVFFQHFANREGNPAVVEFMQTMPSASGRASQIAAAAAWPGMDELFHDYARAFVSDGIIDASGSPIPIQAAHSTLGRHVINDPGEIFRIDDLDPFQIHRIIMEFPERRVFDMEQDFATGIRTGAQEGGPLSPWEELPDPIETCDEPQKWRLMLTTVAPGAEQPAALKVVDIASAEGDATSTTCCLADGEATPETRVQRRNVRIVVCGNAFQAEFLGGVCWVESGFLMVTAGYDVFDKFIEATGPYPRGYAFILGTDQPGTEAPGRPDVSIQDGSELLPTIGQSASITKSDDLLTGTFVTDEISGAWRCPRLTPAAEVRAAAATP